MKRIGTEWYSITGHDPETDTYEYVRSVSSPEEAEQVVKSIIKQSKDVECGRKRHYDRFTMADVSGRIIKSWKGG